MTQFNIIVKGGSMVLFLIFIYRKQHIGIKSTMGHPWKVGKHLRQSKKFIGEDADCLKFVKEVLV
jgi:hypothetical protein